jgi:hypothetical protein
MDPLILEPTVFAETIEKNHPTVRDFFCEGKKDFSNYDSLSQGEIGDCWLLAPMAALAKSSKLRGLLQDNFTINSAERTYSIKLYDGPVGSSFNVDGRLLYLPATEDYKSDLLFAGQQQFIPEKSKLAFKSLWFAFIEKAVAAKLGGYHNLDGGDPNSPDVKQANLGFSLLTGKTANTILIDSTTDFSTTIRDLLAGGAAIVYTTKSNEEIVASYGPSSNKPNNSLAKTNNSLVVANNGLAKTNNSSVVANNSLAKANNSLAKANNSLAKANNGVAKANNGVAKANNSLAKANNGFVKPNVEKRTIKTSPEDKGDKSGLNLLEDHVYVIDRISRDGTVQLYNPHGEFSSVSAINKAKPLTMADAIFFGKRLDIIPVVGGGRLTRRQMRKNNRKSLKY